MKFIAHEGCTIKAFCFNTWYVKIIKINGRDDIYMARGLMILQNPQTNDNDKARGDKQWVTWKRVVILPSLLNFGLYFYKRRSYNTRYSLKTLRKLKFM
jgi:hypothetical protein